jgi:hypothetical protein
MADRPTAKEVSIDLAGFKDSVDRQFSGVDKQIALLTRLVFGLYALLFAVVGGGFLLRSDIGDLKAKVAENAAEITALRRDVGTVQTRLGTIEKGTSDLAAGQAQILTLQNQIVSTLALMNDRLPQSQGNQLVALSADEQQAIREFFDVKGTAKGPAKFRIGDTAPDTKPVPDALVAKIPKLRGLAYAFDPGSGSVLIVSLTTMRVVAVIAPA